jgi:hypothetical protein
MSLVNFDILCVNDIAMPSLNHPSSLGRGALFKRTVSEMTAQMMTYQLGDDADPVQTTSEVAMKGAPPPEDHHRAAIAD